MTLKLFLLSPNIAWTGQVNASGFVYPVQSIPFDGGTAIGTPMPGDTVLFGSVAGADDYGRQRLKTAPSGASGTFEIGRSSQGDRDGEVKPVDDSYITILSLRQVWAKNPEILDDGTIYKDGNIEYDGQTAENSPPKANAGGGKVGTISGGSLSVSFNAGLSFATADGAAISSVLWDIGDGSVTSGTLSSSTLTASFPAGFRYVYLTVTDDNGNTHTASTFVLAIDPANDPTIDNFEITSHTVTKEGQRLSVKILDSVPLNTYPDGTLVLLIDGEPTSASDRTNLKFAGWHQTNRDSTRAERTGIVSETVFECMDIAGRLDTLPGFPLSVQIADTPDNWQQMTLPNMDKYIHYLLMWHSNALELTDFVWSGTGDEYPFVILGSDGQSLYQQVARRAAAFVPDYILTCNSRGQLRIIVDPMLQETADRTATVQAAVTEDDWTSIEYTRHRPPRYHWLWSEAVKASHTELSGLFTVAPGEAPGQGLNSQPQGEQLAISQLDLNNCEGHRYARLNAINSFFSITLADDDIDIEPSDLTWVTVTMSAATAAQRGYSFTAARGLVHEVSISYDTSRTGTAKTVTLMWEKETTGIAALAHFPPEALPAPPYEPEPVGIPSTPPSTAGDGLGTAYIMQGEDLYRTRDLSAASPTWTDIDGGLSTTMWDWILDPWQPATHGYLSTIDGVYRFSDLDGVTPTVDLILSAAAAVSGAGATSFNNPAKITGSINSDGYLALFWYGGDGNIYCSRTNTAREAVPTWAHASVTTAASRFDGAADIVPHVVSSNLVLYCATNTGSASNKTIKVYRSLDGGATWAYRSDVYPVSSSNPLAYSLHCPYNDNDAGSVVYLAARVGSTALAGFYVSTDGASNWTKVYGSVDPSEIHRWAFESYTQNRQLVYAALDVTPGVIKTSSNLFGSVSSPGMSGFSGTIKAAGGFPYLSARSYLTGSDGVFVSSDRGETWANKIGNLTMVASGRHVIVPLWVAE